MTARARTEANAENVKEDLKRSESEKAEREDSRRRVRGKDKDENADTKRRAAQLGEKDIRGRATVVGRWDTRRQNVGNML